jgi:hypothetical protein
MPVTRQITKNNTSKNTDSLFSGGSSGVVNQNIVQNILSDTSFETRPDRMPFEEMQSLDAEVGRVIYDTTNEFLRYWNGSAWEALSGGATSVTQKAANYSSLNAGTEVGELAYVNNSQGTQWLPSTLGGTYYPQGWYIWDGSTWVSDRNNIANQLQLNVTGLSGKSNVGHTHTKSEITDFSDSDYATSAQGLLADTAVQPNDNISTLNNDSQFISFADLNENGLSTFYQEFTYTNGDLTKIEYWDSSSKNTKYFTKDFTYTSGSLTQLVLTNNSNNDTETKSFSYDANGNLINITKS